MSDKKRVLIGILASILAIVLFGFGVHLIEKHGEIDEKFGDTGDWESDSEDIELSLADKDYISTDTAKAFLIAGTDGGGEDKGEGMNGSLADTIIVLLMDDTTKKYAFYTIDRNTMAEVPLLNVDGEYDSYATQQICTAHWYGADEEDRNINLVDAVSDLLGGLDIEGYYILNMEDIAAVNDAIGGVDVYIDTDMTDLDPAFKEGTTVHLTGEQAEHYLRARMSVGDGTNKGRMERQQQYMQNAYNMVISQLRENPAYINDLYDQLKDIIESDGSEREISVIANKMVNLENEGFIDFDGETRINDTLGDGVELEEFYVDESSIVDGFRTVMNLDEQTEEEE